MGVGRRQVIMKHECRLMVILVLIAAKNNLCLTLFAPSIPEYTNECSEELNINYYYPESIELAHNITCLTKCVYEREGRLDSKGIFVLSKFPAESSKAVSECLSIIKSTDLCKTANLMEDCVTHKTNFYLRKYEDCEKYISFDDETEGKRTDCYNRCRMIIDGYLNENGKVNISSITTLNNPNNTLTGEQALDICDKIVSDEDSCTRDLNMYYCVAYILRHESSKRIGYERECAEENNVYPFFRVGTVKPRTCYDRCVMIKTGDLNENDLMMSESFKKFNLSEIDLEEYFKTCKITMQETDKCTKDLYFYDCINYIHQANPSYLRKQKECAEETNSPLVSYRQPYKENACNTRCLMIRENKLDKGGVVNRTDLRQYTINETIIDQSITACNKNRERKTCQDDVNTYYCVSAKVNEKIRKMCFNETNTFRSITSMGNNFCSRRCMMINSGQLTPTGEINMDSLNENVILVEEAIKTCKSRFIDEDACAKDFHLYYCVRSVIDI